MKKAIKLAEKAFQNNEIPVGAIVVSKNRIIGKGYNQKEKFTFNKEPEYQKPIAPHKAITNPIAAALPIAFFIFCLTIGITPYFLIRKPNIGYLKISIAATAVI